MPQRRRGRPPHPDLLTPAERRVLEELRKGGTNAEIAVRIGIGPETVKTHISNMLAKLQLEDRQQLAAWREEDAPRRRRWLLAPILLRPLVAAGAVAGVAVVVVVILLLLALVRGEPEALYIEGVGDIEGPVALIRVSEIVDTRPRLRLAAVDLPTGKRWFLDGVTQFSWGAFLDAVAPIALARDRLVVWDDESIHLVTLDGQIERVLFRSDELFSAPVVSPDGDLIAFTLLPAGPRDIGGVVVVNLRSGEEVFRLPGNDPRIPPHGKLELERWSTDGGALLVSAIWSSVLTAAHVVLELDGSVYAFPEEVRRTSELAFSPDVRHVVRGKLLSPENYDSDALAVLGDLRLRGKAWVESLAIVEVGTGRELAVVVADDGDALAHVVGPVDGRIVYATIPVNEVPLENTAEAFTTMVEGIGFHVFDLATGTSAPFDQLDGSLRDVIELESLREDNVDRLASAGRCIETLSAWAACDSAADMYDRIRTERDAEREPVWRLIGIIWID